MRGAECQLSLKEIWKLTNLWLLQVTLLYTAPTAIRALQSFGDSFVTKYSRKSLRILGTVGEPINPEAWKWYHEVVFLLLSGMALSLHTATDGRLLRELHVYALISYAGRIETMVNSPRLPSHILSLPHWGAAVRDVTCVWGSTGGGRGEVSIVDTWWQTETGAHMITPLPGATTLKPGSATLPFFGVEPAVLNEKGEEQEGECEG